MKDTRAPHSSTTVPPLYELIDHSNAGQADNLGSNSPFYSEQPCGRTTEDLRMLLINIITEALTIVDDSLVLFDDDADKAANGTVKELPTAGNRDQA